MNAAIWKARAVALTAITLITVLAVAVVITRHTESAAVIERIVATVEDSVVTVNATCSGTVIAPDKVVTATHCRKPAENSADGVPAVGWTDIEGTDVSIMTLATHIMRPVLPMSQYRPAVHQKGELVGYGITESTEYGVRHRHEVAVIKYDAGLLWVQGEGRACRSDSGGTLIVDGMLVGIISQGDPFCRGQYQDTGVVPVADIRHRMLEPTVLAQTNPGR